MNKKNSILIIENPEEHLFDEWSTLLRGKGEWSGFEATQARFPDAHTAADKLMPQAIILNVNQQKSEVKAVLNRLSQRKPRPYCVIGGSTLEPEELVDFMRLGANDLLISPIKNDEFKDLMDRIECWLNVNGDNQGNKSHSIISFFSAKGGVGLTTLAANTAVSLVERQAGRVLLADFVLAHGNTAELLDTAAHYTLIELSENLDRLDKKLLENSLPKHKSGLFLLPSPKRPAEAEHLASQDATRAIGVLKESFDYTIVDTGHELNNAVISCLDHSDTIFLVTTPDLPSLSNTKMALETFRQLGYKPEKIKLVLNRWQIKGEIEAAVIEKNLETSFYMKFPNDPETVLSAVNQGVPLSEIDKKSKIVKSFADFAEMITGVKDKKEAKPAPKLKSLWKKESPRVAA